MKYQELLKSNFWIIPKSQLDFSKLNFLNEFFNISEIEIYDENKEILKQFYILVKKEKYLGLTL